MLANTPAMLECALRRADDGRGAQHAQHAARCRGHRLHARPCRDQGADHRPRVRQDDEGGARHRQGQAAGHRLRRSRIPAGRRAARHARLRGLPRRGRSRLRLAMPDDEWDAISLNYTSGTTGNPKGVVYHHRGAYLLAHGNVLTGSMPKHAVYLWTLPMFHCNGWCFPWSMSVVAGTHVCLRWVRQKPVWDALADHGVTHLCGAPIVMSTILSTPAADRRQLDRRSSSSPPPRRRPRRCSPRMARSRLQRHPSLRPDRDLRPRRGQRVEGGMGPPRRRRPGAPEGAPGRALSAARGPYRHGPRDHEPVPADGATIGEVMFRGNIVMKGYLKNPKATDEAFARRLVPFRRSRRAASRRLHPAQGPLQGHHHLRAARTSRRSRSRTPSTSTRRSRPPPSSPSPTRNGARRPCAFVELRGGKAATADELIAWCRDRLARYKVPAPRRLRRTAEDLDRQDPEENLEIPKGLTCASQLVRGGFFFFLNFFFFFFSRQMEVHEQTKGGRFRCRYWS